MDLFFPLAVASLPCPALPRSVDLGPSLLSPAHVVSTTSSDMSPTFPSLARALDPTAHQTPPRSPPGLQTHTCPPSPNAAPFPHPLLPSSGPPRPLHFPDSSLAEALISRLGASTADWKPAAVSCRLRSAEALLPWVQGPASTEHGRSHRVRSGAGEELERKAGLADHSKMS